MATYNVTVADYIANSPYPGADVVTLLDTADNLAGLTTVQIGQLATNGVDFINSSEDVINWSVAQWQAVPGGVGFDASDLKVVFDTGANLATLSTGDLADLNTYGVTLINAQDGAVTFDVAQYQAMGGISIDAGVDATLGDTGANIEGLSAAEIGALSIKGFDVIDASDDAVSLSVDQALALGSISFDGSDTVTVLDTAAHLEALTGADFNQLAANGVSAIDSSDNVLTLDDTQYSAIVNSGMALTGADDVTLADTGAAIAGHDFNTLSVNGIDFIDATDDQMTIGVNQANELIAGDVVASDGTDVITLADTGFNIANNISSFSSLGEVGVDQIDVTSGGLGLTVAHFDDLNDDGVVFVDASDEIDVLDSTANIDALTASHYAQLIGQGVDFVDAVSGTGAYTIDKATASEVVASGLTFASNDTVTVADTGANLGALTATEIAALAGHGIDALDASDDALTLDVAKFNSLGTVSLTAGDAVTLADSDANITGFGGEGGGVDFSALVAKGVDFIDATDNQLHLSVSQADILINESGIGIDVSDVVTLYDNGAAIGGVSAGDLVLYGELGVSIIDASDDAVTFDTAQLDAINGVIALTGADVVTLQDAEATIEALNAGELGGYAEQGVDVIRSNSGSLQLNASQVDAVLSNSVSFYAADTVTLYDSGANIAALSLADFQAMAEGGVDAIDASDNVLNLTVAKFEAIAGSVSLTGADTVSLVDTGANLGAMSAEEIATLAGYGVDKLNASNNVLTLSVAQYNALGAVQLTGGDVVSIKDTGANLATLDFSTLAANKVDAIDAIDNVLTISYTQFSQLGTVSLAAGDDVTLTATSSVIEGLSGSQLLALGGKGIDHIDTTDNQLHFSLSQFNNLGSVTVASNDVFTIVDSEANLETMGAGKINSLNAAGVDFIDSTNDTWNMTAAVAKALTNGAAKATAADAVTVVDTGAAIASMTVGQFGQLASHNVDALDATDNDLTLSVGQYGALGTVALTQSDYVTLADSGSLIASQSLSFLAGLDAAGVDAIDATDDVLNLSVAQFEALNVPVDIIVGPSHLAAPDPSGVELTSSDTVTLVDTGTNLASLSASEIADLELQNVDALDSTTNLLTLNVDQFNALGSVTLTLADVVTIKDTGTALVGLDISMLGAQGVDRIDASDNALTASQNFIDTLGEAGVALTKADVVTMTASEGAIESLTASDLAAYGAQGVDIIDVSGTANMAADQIAAMINGGVKFSASSDVELDDTSANVLANLGALFGNLASTGVDRIDLSDNVIDLTVAQATALNGVTFASNDTGVTVQDESSALEGLTAAQIAALGAAGVDSVDATDDVLSFTVEQGAAGIAAGITIDASDVATLADTGEAIAAIDASVFAMMGEFGVDFIDATDNQLALNVAQYEAISGSGVQLTAGDTVTLADTGANLAAMGPAEIAALAAAGIDQIDVTDDSMSISMARFQAFQNAGFTFGSEDTISVKGTAGANTLTGGAEHDVFSGLDGNDVLSGGKGADTLIGGLGSDTLTGGAGSDHFVFQSVDDSSVGAADRIIGLQNADVIDLSKIDADTTTGGNQAFHMVDHFTGHAGELTIKYNAGADLTVVKLDVNGDGVADSQIAISGDHHDFTNFVF